ncbi:MAG TPA: hypothetical protein VM901_06535 [Bdellovibrionota bacterium]|jgi:hypothetical protein|nr:hypothetical protein [Bdellovibrionota bacterium]
MRNVLSRRGLPTLFLATTIAGAAPVCDVRDRAPSPEFERLQGRIDSRFAAFAATPAVSGPADATLVKLTKAQSPVIVQWMKSRNLGQAKDEVILREWRIYYAKNFVFAQYPRLAPAVNQSIESFVDEIFARELRPEKIKTFEAAFARTQALALQRIEQMPIASASKAALLTKVRAIRLYWMKGFKNSKYQAYPLEAISWGVAYDPVANEINMGIEALRYPDEATLISVFAHEMGHAFDPCRWSSFFSGENPFAAVTSCLRQPASAGARHRDDSQMDSLIKAGSLTSELASALKQHPTCNKREYPPIGIQADQILESFADWFSAEVLSLASFTQFPRTDLCAEQSLVAGSSYIPNADRIAKIYLAHPAIRKKLKMNADPQLSYCELK